MTSVLELLQPRRPKTTVAKKPVDKNHATASMRAIWQQQLIWHRVGTKGLPPVKNFRRSQGFAQPRLQQLALARLRHWIAPVDPPEQHEFKRQKDAVTERYSEKTNHSQHRRCGEKAE